MWSIKQILKERGYFVSSNRRLTSEQFNDVKSFSITWVTAVDANFWPCYWLTHIGIAPHLQGLPGSCVKFKILISVLHMRGNTSLYFFLLPAHDKSNIEFFFNMQRVKVEVQSVVLLQSTMRK